jgi:hypothetical protein
MSDTPKYNVFPKKVEPQPTPGVDSLPLEEYEKSKIKGLNGCAGFIIAVVAFSAILAWGASARMDIGLEIVLGGVAATIGVALVHWAIRSERISQKEREKAQRAKESVESSNKSAVSNAENEARYLSLELIRNYDSSEVTAGELSKHLAQAGGWIRKAEGEFNDNAFGPFWDAVENAAQQMSAFNAKANQLSSAAGKYYGGLNGRTHTFPSFPTNATNLPDPTPALNDLRRVVRMGQTNFQFANIWEHRRTREVMIAGFHTLGEAVNNLGSVVENSLGSLQQSISSDVARLVQEQITTRDSLDRRMVEQNRMLDNIQHRRQPGAGDTPSRY